MLCCTLPSALAVAVLDAARAAVVLLAACCLPLRRDSSKREPFGVAPVSRVHQGLTVVPCLSFARLQAQAERDRAALEEKQRELDQLQEVRLSAASVVFAAA